MLGISTTVTFFYLGWACIALRAYRVKAVFDTYEKYLQLLQAKNHAAKDDEVFFSMVTHNADEFDSSNLKSPGAAGRKSVKKSSKYNTKKLGQLQETTLIKKTLLYFILPNALVGLVALFS